MTMEYQKLKIYQLYQTFSIFFDTLIQCRTIDLSFNRIEVIENLEKLTKVKALYLASNLIKEISSLSALMSLEILELGANRISVFFFRIN